MVYEFGGFQIDLAQRILVRNGEPIVLTPKVFDLLALLVQGNGRILKKEELMSALWPESFVEEGNLTQNIFVLRKVLGDDRNGHRVIQTVSRQGYKFVASVREAEASTLKSGLLADYWSRNSPFRGLQVFEPEDAWLFFGRDSETQDLVGRLSRSPVLMIVGNSGSGKSSLVRAGLIPALRAGRLCHEGSVVDSWRVAVFRPSASPFDYLAEVLANQLAPELGLEEQAKFIADCRTKFPAGGNALRDAITALAGAMPEQSRLGRILLVADQFEEIFTLTADPQARDRYIDALLAASQMDRAVPVHLVLALRADFYGHCLEHAGLSRCLETNLYNVPRMTREQLRETVEKRLDLAAARAESGLIDSLLEDVGAEPGNLALLEHALGQMWEKCGGSGCTLTNRAYAEIGRLRGALGRHADEVYTGLGDEQQKRLAKKVFLELVHLGEGGNVQDTRRRLPKADLLALGAAEEVELLLERLASSRLISTGREGEQVFVEVSHEALIREWPALREWLTENREELRLERRLQQAAEEWNGLKRDAGALLRGARLAQGEEWLARASSVPPLLRDFLQASMVERDETERKELTAQKRKVARQRWFLSALAALLLVAVGVAWFAYREQAIQKSRAMAAQSGELLSRDRGQALDLAIRSWRVAKTEEARFAVAKAFPEPLLVLKHEGLVGVTRFSPDGRLILSGSWDHTARVWSADDGRLLVTLRGHTDKVNDVAFSPDGQRIVTASYDHTARVWSSADGRLLAVLQGHSDEIWQARFSPDGQRIVTASSDKTARVWSAVDGRLLAALQGHTYWILRAQFSPDGQRIVTASYDHTARIWNSIDGRLQLTLKGHQDWVVNAVFSPDGQQVVTTSTDRTARIWSAVDGRLLAILQHRGPVSHAEFSPDGKHIVTASYDRTARVWNSADGRLLFTLQHDGPVHYTEFSTDGQWIVTAGYDHLARVWSTSNGRLLATLEGHVGEIYHATFSLSGDRILTGSGDGTVRMWNTGTGRSLIIFQGHTGYVSDAQFSPDNKRIVTASGDHTAQMWSSTDGHVLAILQGHSDQLYSARFSADGQRIVTACMDGTARVWNTADGRLLAALQGHTGWIWKAHFSPDGQRIVTAGEDHTARVWNAVDGRLLATLQGHSGYVWDAQFSPDAQRIVTASSDKTARVWNAADGRLLAILQGHTDWVSRAHFSPDGQRIVTASQDHTARVWNATDGRLLATLQGSTDSVSAVQFSPDGQRIVAAGADRIARVWNVANGRLLATLQGHAGWISNAEFSPDGQRIVTASRDQAARVWQILTLDDINRILAK